MMCKPSLFTEVTASRTQASYEVTKNLLGPTIEVFISFLKGKASTQLDVSKEKSNEEVSEEPPLGLVVLEMNFSASKKRFHRLCWIYFISVLF